ncbi:MAG: D-alanine--D-alanine ligase [Pseudomonadota bacterium]|nr:D-alanine--D-alanine ligase [Pseudomonadota bacterium]
MQWSLRSNNKSPESLGRVVVLMGGDSAERDISLNTGKNILEALHAMKVDAYGIDVGLDIATQLQGNRPDRAFIALHGPGGEDGVMQGLLEWMKIPYTGSDVTSSAVSMNKALTKWVWEANDIPTLPMHLITPGSDYREHVERLGFPLCVKPTCEGSSVGVTRVDNWEALPAALASASQFNAPVMLEPWIDGRELTVGIIGDYALPVLEIRPKSGFYDYKNKYQKGATEYHCPATMSEPLTQKIRALSLKAFNVLGCRHWGRIDLMLDRQEGIWLLENNTVPGMTGTSLVPKAAKVEGVSFEQLVYEILWQSV